MASTLKPLYGTYASLTITSLNSLINNAYAGSAVVDNTTALLDDAFISATIVSASTATSATGSITIYAYGTTDSTSHYSDGITGTDAVQTPTSPPNLRMIGIGNVVANSTTYRVGPFSVAAAFGGRLPDHWGIVVYNQSGATLAATGNLAAYLPIQDQIV